jgi:hypothetical protein
MTLQDTKEHFNIELYYFKSPGHPTVVTRWHSPMSLNSGDGFQARNRHMESDLN